MHCLSRRPTATLVAVLLTVPAMMACSPEPVSPLPGQPGVSSASAAPSDTPASTPAAPASTPSSRSTARTSATRSPAGPTRTLEPACHGAVVYEVDDQIGHDVCLSVGGVVRIPRVPPGAYQIRPAGIASCRWEAGVVDCRLTRPGNVTITVTDEHRVYAVTVID